MAHPKSVLQKRVACIRRMQFKGLGFPNKHFATQNGLCIYEDTACYECERLLNCKMIFRLLYWAYQIFFREDVAVTAQTMQIGSRPCRIYGEAHAEYLLLQMTGEHELQSMDDEVAAIAQSNRKYLFAAIPAESWNDALSPWEAPAVWGKQGFGGKAGDTLRFLTEQVIPTLEQQFRLPKNVKIILGGYSLAGLFALWVSTQTDLFYGVAAASPSVWFPGWMEFEQQHPMQAQHVYLSLGDKEERTKNTVMAAVGDGIRALHSRLTERGANCTLEWNSGGHFKDADLRTAKAFRWAMEEHT
jgi:predicted alpha/beta superfamily hydrolase